MPGYVWCKCSVCSWCPAGGTARWAKVSSSILQCWTVTSGYHRCWEPIRCVWHLHTNPGSWQVLGLLFDIGILQRGCSVKGYRRDVLDLWNLDTLMSLVSWYDSIPFHFRIFSISTLTLTYHDARNWHDASHELHEPTRLWAHSMLDFR